ncbi:MAG TPA: NTP transferase domain-containing protein [Planctomycetota bacterium]|nr:NTP transferase domain-containing protein [Planctomycetota bacterium]
MIVAAGRGRRMGGDKALLDLNGEPAIAHAVGACRGGGARRVVVVRAAGADPLPADLDVEVVEADQGAEMIDSIRAGLRALAGCAAAVLFPVDHALASAATVRALVRRLRAAERPAFVLPLYDGRPGHPIAVPAALFDAVLDPGTATLRDVVRAAPVDTVAVRDPWVLRDLDTPEDLAVARAWLGGVGRTVVEVMRAHRSRRAYRPDPVPDEQIAALVDAARHASTSSFIQAYAVIAVRDAERRAAVAKLCGDQEHIRQAPVFLAICADLNKLGRSCARHGTTLDAGPLETFLQATVDAALLGQNLLLAAESQGLGGCMIGAARDHPVELARLLGLPKHAYVVFGMTLGHPADDPVARERMPLEGVLFFERYDEARLDAALDGADAAMRAWAAECNRRGGYLGRRVDERKGWADRMAVQWSKEKARPTPRLRLREHLLDLGFGLL